MIVLYIIAAVIGVFAILFWCRIHISLAYDGSDIAMSVRYTFLRIKLLPRKPKKIKLRDYTYKKIQKKKKAEKKADKKKAAKKKSRKSGKKKTKQAHTTGAAAEGGKKKSSTAKLLYDLRHAVLELLIKFPGKLRLVIKRLYITVGAEDAAKTAITYGTVTQAVGTFLTLAQKKADVRVKENAVMVSYDFILGKIVPDIDATLSIRVGSILRLAIRFFFDFLKVILSQNKD